MQSSRSILFVSKIVARMQISALPLAALRPSIQLVPTSRFLSSIARPSRVPQLRQSSYLPRSRRTFFSLADIAKLIPDAAKPGGGQGSAKDVQEFHARKILPYTREQLYTIVADVPSYSAFIPFCTSSRITSSSSSPSPSSSSAPALSPHNSNLPPTTEPFDIQATLSIGFASFSEQFTSRVQGVPFEEVRAEAVDSPLFEGLRTTWRFTPASPSSPHATSTPTGLPAPSSSTSPLALSAIPPSSGPTLLTIDLSFSFVNPLHQIASQAFLPRLEELMVGAFEKRCLEVYGKGQV